MAGTRQFRAKPLAMITFSAKILWRILGRRFKGFGTAAASFGPPVSLRAFYASSEDTTTEALAARLMAEITRAVPVLSVPLVAAALVQKPQSRADLTTIVTTLSAELIARGATMKLPPLGLQASIDEALPPLIRRGLIGEDLVIAPDAEPVIAYYAASVQQFLTTESDKLTVS
jgi:glycerol-3-phosphate O-acyltransferase